MSGRDKRLGRGLAALLGDAEPTTPAASSDEQPRTIPIDRIIPGLFQPRRGMSKAMMDELVASIRHHGVLQPILVRPHPVDHGHFEIIAGERRWRAAQEAKLTEIPVFIRAMDARGATAAALVENLQRQDLNAIEEALGFQRLMDEFKLTQESLGDAVGKSRSYVANALRLLNLPPAVQDAVTDGRLTAGHARALLSHANPEQAAQLVMTRGLNVRQTEALITNRQSAPRTRTEVDPDIAALEQQLAETLGLRVTIAHAGASGELRIKYASLDQLDGVISLLSRN